MLKFFGRTIFKYALFVKYKSSIVKVVLGFLVIIATHFLYADVAESLKASQSLECLSMVTESDKRICIDKKENYRVYALIFKWIVMLSAVSMIIMTLNPVTKKSRRKKKESKKKQKKVTGKKANAVVNQMMDKNHLRSEADRIWEDLQK